MTSVKCMQQNCDNTATMSYVWPGDPTRLYVCGVCFMRASDVSKAMGCVLGDVCQVLRENAQPKPNWIVCPDCGKAIEIPNENI